MSIEPGCRSCPNHSLVVPFNQVPHTTQATEALDSRARRRVIQLSAGLVIGATGLAAGSAHALPVIGDRLVLDDAEPGAAMLRLQDIPLTGKPVLAVPFDPASKTIKNDTRLNKLVLQRFAEADLDAETRARAAEGVIAYSAICTHQACEVKTWIAKDKALVCFCHASQFMPLEQARVNNGPAPRALPAIALRVEGDELVIASAFSGKPGGSG